MVKGAVCSRGWVRGPGVWAGGGKQANCAPRREPARGASPGAQRGPQSGSPLEALMPGARGTSRQWQRGPAASSPLLVHVQRSETSVFLQGTPEPALGIPLPWVTRRAPAGEPDLGSVWVERLQVPVPLRLWLLRMCGPVTTREAIESLLSWAAVKWLWTRALRSLGSYPGGDRCPAKRAAAREFPGCLN